MRKIGARVEVPGIGAVEDGLWSGEHLVSLAAASKRNAIMPLVTAIEMAAAAGVNQKRFRQALRDENLAWHQPKTHWEVEKDSPEHDDMRRVLAKLTGRG